MTLVSVNELFWPVFRHSFKYSVRTTAPLNPIEEGILRVASAGVADLAEASRFLGAGSRSNHETPRTGKGRDTLSGQVWHIAA